MKKLEKLKQSQLTNTQSIKGGAGIYLEFFAEDTPTTTHTPSKGALAEHYSCDHGPDNI